MNLSHAIVLTGSISTGKSTVGSLLSLYGFKIIDADKVAHKMLDKNSSEIAVLFGSEYVSDGKVDRKKLGGLVFNDKEKLKKLEEFLHPLIKEEIKKESLICESQDVPYILDIPLFFENKNYDLDEVAVVYTPKEIQLQRLMSRDNISKEEAEKKISLQMDIEKKAKQADFVIDNSKNFKHLQKEVDRFVEYIKGKYAHLKI